MNQVGVKTNEKIIKANKLSEQSVSYILNLFEKSGSSYDVSNLY